MFCPNCGQQQSSEKTKFCSRCGLSLAGVKELVFNNQPINENLVKRKSDVISPRRKGVKQGGQLMIFGLIAVPLIVLFSVLLNLHPTFAVISAILTFWGGILRILYALLFESKYPTENDLQLDVFGAARKLLGRKTKSLAEPQSISVSSFVPPPVATGNWLNTNDLIQPPVTENKTQFIVNDR